jgi:cytochrome oxidase Cu insertion factor (SCO1/SenC/PrrC family)
LIGLLFMGPFFAAYIWYFYVPDVRPEGRVNYGTLVAPVRPLTVFAGTDAEGKPVDQAFLHDKWSLVHVGAERCDEACAHRLYLSRQVRARLSRDRTRVQRVYVAPSAGALADVRAQIGNEHPDLVWIVDTNPAGQRLAEFVKPTLDGSLYLFDPLGNWVMSYPPDFEPAGLYKDFKHLLKLSGIG